MISHTHWDREWFVPAGFARAWLVPFFDALLNLLEREPAHRFTLDGQSILLEDYLLQLSGEEQERVAHRISRCAHAGRLILGPYYQQPDWQLVSGEALIRNLLIGCADAASLAGESRSRVGWLLDNFGHIGQAVQIHRGFGMRGLYAWRGFDLLPDRVRDVFQWRSYDGSSLPVVYLLDSYRNGMRLFGAPEFTERRLTAAAERVRPFSSDGRLLLMNGYDQEMEPENIPAELSRLCEEWNRAVTVSDPEEYLRLKEVDGPTVVGAQRSGRFISVFPGVLSARNYLKIANHRAETAMSRYLDPLIALVGLRGTDGYDAGKLRPESDLLWRLILQNHPHDTICGVSSDPVHEETELRLAEIEKRQRLLLHRLAALLRPGNPGTPASGGDGAAAGAPRRPGTLVFNPSLYSRRALVADGDGDECLSRPIPPLSVAAVTAGGEAAGGEAAGGGAAPSLTEEGDHHVLSNGLVTARIGGGGSLTLRDEQSGVTMENLLGILDTGDAGDSYSEERLEGDSREGIDGLRPTRTRRTSARVSVAVSGILELPLSLAPSRRERSEERAKSNITLLLELRRGEPFVRLTLRFLNRSRDHRLQLRFRSSRPEGRVLSLTQFAWEEPAAQLPPAAGTVEPPPEVRRLMLGAREPELSPVFPTAGAVAAGDEIGALLVAQEGLFEGELLGGGDFGLTLLRCVGWLARGDLRSRTGDAGPEIFAPEAQCLRPFEVRLAVAPLSCLEDATGWRGSRIIEEFSAPMVSLGTSGLTGAESADREQPDGVRSLLPDLTAVDGLDGCRLSTVKPAELLASPGSLILRLSNPWSTPLELPAVFSKATRRVNLDETEVTDSGEPGVLGPFEIGSFLYPTDDGRRAPREAQGAEESWNERFAAALSGALPYHRFGRRPFRLPPDAWSWLFAEEAFPPSSGGPARQGELPSSETPRADGEERRRWREYLTEGVTRETERLRELQLREEESAAAYEAARREDPGMRRRETIVRRSALSTYHRRRLEAELSLTFARWTLRRVEGEPSEAEERRLYRTVEELALKLNHARVAKRADDYLIALE